MGKYVSRRKHRAALILLYSFAAVLIVGFLFSNIPIMLTSLPLLIAFTILDFSTNRCPQCVTFFRGLYWSKPNAGHCIKCGKVIEFDDCGNDNE